MNIKIIVKEGGSQWTKREKGWKGPLMAKRAIFNWRSGRPDVQRPHIEKGYIQLPY